MKRFICQKCGNGFNFATKPQFCPFCGGSNVLNHDVKSRETALNMIEEYKGIITQLGTFAEEYSRLTKRAKDIRKALATYKCRKIITEDEIPYSKNETLLSQIKKSNY